MPISKYIIESFIPDLLPSVIAIIGFFITYLLLKKQLEFTKKIENAKLKKDIQIKTVEQIFTYTPQIKRQIINFYSVTNGAINTLQSHIEQKRNPYGTYNDDFWIKKFIENAANLSTYKDEFKSNTEAFITFYNSRKISIYEFMPIITLINTSIRKLDISMHMLVLEFKYSQAMISDLSITDFSDPIRLAEHFNDNLLNDLRELYYLIERLEVEMQNKYLSELFDGNVLPEAPMDIMEVFKPIVLEDEGTA